MQKNSASVIIALLILITSSTLAISMLPTTLVSAAPELENDMPVVFIDPPISMAEPGDTVTISVKIFNLSNTFALTSKEWHPGDPPPVHNPAALMFNYSFGNLYGFDIGLKWDINILEYVSHTVYVPVDTYPQGVLNEPIIDIKNNVSETGALPGSPPGSLYWLAQSSFYPAKPFNAPGANATVFSMTFKVKRNGLSFLNFTGVEISDPVAKPIPHWLHNGQFQTGALATRVDTLSVYAEADDAQYPLPVIAGENAAVQVTMTNDNLTETDTYDLALYYDDSLLLDAVWEDRVLGPQESETLNYTIQSPETGQHSVTARATISHGGGTIMDELTVQFAAIGTPTLAIDGPETATEGQIVTFTAAASTHGDPQGQITNYTWTLWRPGEVSPWDTEFGESVEFDLPDKITRFGNWTVMLVVLDSYGVTAHPPAGSSLSPTSTLRRPSTAPYRTTFKVLVSEAPPPSLFTLENIVLILILVVIIAAAVVYLRRRSR